MGYKGKQRTPIGLFMELGLHGETWIKGKAGTWVCGIDLAHGEDETIVAHVKDGVVTIQRSGSTPTDVIKALHRAWEAHEANAVQEKEIESAQADEARTEDADQPGES